MRFEVAAIIRATTYQQTAKPAVQITKRFLESKYVVRDFQSHGMRALAKSVQRTNTKLKRERPHLDGIDHDFEEMKLWKAGESAVFGRGETIFSEGTFVTWDIDCPPIEKYRIDQWLGDNEDIIRHHVSAWSQFNTAKKCNGMPDIDYIEVNKKLIRDEGALPLVHVFRNQALNVFPDLAQSPDIQLFEINKQKGASNNNKHGLRSPFGTATIPGARGYYKSVDSETGESPESELLKIPK